MATLSMSRSWRWGYSICRVYRVFCYSTSSTGAASKTSPVPRPSLSAPTPKDELYRKLLLAKFPKSSSVLPVIDQWVEGGHPVDADSLLYIVKRLRDLGRHRQALEVFLWMEEKKQFLLSSKHTGLHVDLIAKVHGFNEAENFFQNLPVKDYQAYVSLLSSCASKKLLEKSEEIMQKIRSLGYVKSPQSYNIMMKMYCELGMHEKVDGLKQEMEEKGIDWNIVTYNIQLSTYAASNDVKRMENLLSKMEADPMITMDWKAYVTAATGYLNGKKVDKAVEILKRIEHMARVPSNKVAYNSLLTLYGRAKKKEDVYRLWNSYKKTFTASITGYVGMVQALIKLDDLDEAEKMIEECRCCLGSNFDYKIVNLLIRAYCKKGDFEKAKELISKVTERTKQDPPASTWDILASGYVSHKRMQDAVEITRKVMLESEDRLKWKLNRYTLISLVEYLRNKGDEKGLEQFRKLMEAHDLNSRLPADFDSQHKGEMANNNEGLEMEAATESK